MADSDNRPLFFWKADTLDRGDRTVVGAYLNDLSRRLRDNPTPEECEAAAQAFDRIVTRGPAAWAACGFIAANRPSRFRRKYEIWWKCAISSCSARLRRRRHTFVLQVSTRSRRAV